MKSTVLAVSVVYDTAYQNSNLYLIPILFCMNVVNKV
jgi:hypothetical protein